MLLTLGRRIEQCRPSLKGQERHQAQCGPAYLGGETPENILGLGVRPCRGGSGPGAQGLSCDERGLVGAGHVGVGQEEG